MYPLVCDQQDVVRLQITVQRGALVHELESLGDVQGCEQSASNLVDAAA